MGRVKQPRSRGIPALSDASNLFVKPVNKLCELKAQTGGRRRPVGVQPTTHTAANQPSTLAQPRAYSCWFHTPLAVSHSPRYSLGRRSGRQLSVVSGHRHPSSVILHPSSIAQAEPAEFLIILINSMLKAQAWETPSSRHARPVFDSISLSQQSQPKAPTDLPGPFQSLLLLSGHDRDVTVGGRPVLPWVQYTSKRRPVLSALPRAVSCRPGVTDFISVMIASPPPIWSAYFVPARSITEQCPSGIVLDDIEIQVPPVPLLQKQRAARMSNQTQATNPSWVLSLSHGTSLYQPQVHNPLGFWPPTLLSRPIHRHVPRRQTRHNPLRPTASGQAQGLPLTSWPFLDHLLRLGQATQPAGRPIPVLGFPVWDALAGLVP
ncbi:hypothetical protein B0J13DRAFT_600962 [Dactylonectria estremocensis]|uniref:Uncharacterized protein n=1 Tax=Dactylonectria estremocensis TaxID=1079267 RepID=A0A9P9FGE4_9HYPO|nr:hypothetical protein B0J13DRAFT_600962 [Dactylonectria estremocensis]